MRESARTPRAVSVLFPALRIPAGLPRLHGHVQGWNMRLCGAEEPDLSVVARREELTSGPTLPANRAESVRWARNGTAFVFLTPCQYSTCNAGRQEMGRKETEGDNRQRRAAAKEAREQGLSAGEVGASLGSSKQQAES